MFVLLFQLLFAPASAQDLPDCSTPQRAADTLLALLQPEDFRPESAAACLDLPPELEADGPRIAVELKQVLDARGHYVPVADLSDDPEWMPEDGDEVVLVEQLPVVYLEKVGADWRWSRATIRALPELHAETFNGLGAWVRATLPGWFTTTRIGAFSPWQGILLALLVLLGVLGSTLANWLLKGRLHALVTRLGMPLDQKAFDRTRAPMRLLAFGAVLMWGAPELQLGIQPSQVVWFIARVLVSVSVVWIALRWIDVFAGLATQRASETSSRMDDQSIPLLRRMAQVTAVVLGLVFVLQNMGVDVASLIAGLGIGGLALALGAQDTLKHLFGSLTIFFDRPFQVGDFVEVGGVSGTIEEVGFRSTRIRTSATSVVTVPNSTVANATVDNMGVRTFRRVTTTLGLTYDTSPEKIEAFVEGLRAIIEEHPATRKDGVQIHFKDFSASSLDVMVWFYLDVPSWGEELSAKHDIFLRFMKLAGEQGVEFAFPTQTVHLQK